MIAEVLDESKAHLSVYSLAEAIRNKEISPLELVELLLHRIEKIDGHINSYIWVNPRVEEDARRAERAVFQGFDLGPLHGVPISIKDIIATADGPTTAGSKVSGVAGLEGKRDAEVVRLLRQAGALVLGKTNLHEFAFGITSENEHFGPVRNPWDRSRVAGGSSGGSAAAVVSGLSPASVGTDTRGSIRIPSACCGATGLKPTLGKVSTNGVLPLSWTLDHVGPICASARDAALLTAIMSGDAVNTQIYLNAVGQPPSSLKVGICPYYFRDLQPCVRRAVEEGAASLEKTGAQIVEVQMDTLDDALTASDIITRAEAVAIHDEHLREQPEGYGDKVKKRISSGYEVSGIDLVRAERSLLETTREFEKVFESVDCLLAPTLPLAAPPLGTEFVSSAAGDVTLVHEFVRLNAPQNMAGLPAITIPCGFTEDRLPIGMQIVARRGGEETILSLSGLYQRETDWHTRRPPVEDLE